MGMDELRAQVTEVVRTRPDETIPGILRAAAERHPLQPLVIFPDEDGSVITYAAAADHAEAMARHLLAWGVGRGAHVAIHLPNRPAYVWSWLGSMMAGSVDVALDPAQRGTSLAYALDKGQVDAVITDRDGLEVLETAGALDREPLVFVLDADAQTPPETITVVGWRRWTVSLEPAEAGAAMPTAAFDFGSPYGLTSIKFTSGSTGFPKGVMMSQGHMLSNARMYAHVTEMRPEDRLYTCFPVHHVFSSVMGIVCAICADATVVLARRFSASRYWEHVRSYDVTVGHILDAPANILLAAEPSELDREHSCRIMVSAPNAPGFEERFGVTMMHGYDMSELTLPTHHPLGIPVRKGSQGLSGLLFDVAIVDEHDNLQPVGQPGEIVVRPRVPHVMTLGYFGDYELTTRRWRNLWFHTDDLGRLDENGYLYFLGRTGDRIRRRGVNVSAEELEAAATCHVAVGEAVVIAVPDPMGEDDIKLCVVLKDEQEATPAEIVEHMRGQVTKNLVPRFVEIREDFPRTSTDKVRKAALREEGEHGLTPGSWDAETGGYLGTSGRNPADAS